MKLLQMRIMALVLLLAVLFGTPGTASAATTLVIKASAGSGVYYTDSALRVTLTTYPGATIIYTTNGRIPSASVNLLGNLSIREGFQYTGPLSFTKSTTLRAIAVKRWTSNSAVYSYTYELFAPGRLATNVKNKHNGFNYNSYPSPMYYTASNGKQGYLTKTYTGITPGTVNCTWYTLARIRYNLNRDILFSTPGGLDGRYWYSKAVSNSKQIKYGGNNALEALVKANGNRPVYNIVVSFERNGKYTNGHVMMIDAIINGRLYYSDNSQPGVFTSSSTITDFKKKYAGYNGNIIGVVHLQ